MRNVLRPISMRLYYIVDFLVILVSMAFSWIYKTWVDSAFEPIVHDYLIVLAGLIPLYLITYTAFDLYSSKRNQSFGNELVKIIEANIVGCILLFGVFFILKLSFISRALFIQFALINTVLSLFTRFFVKTTLRFIRSHGYNLRYMLVIGAGDLGKRFMKRLERHREFGYQVIGFLDDDKSKKGMRVGKVRIIDTIDKLSEHLAMHHIDEVIVALPLSAYEKLGSIIHVCEKYGVKVSIIPDYFRYIPTRPKVTEFDDIPLIHVRDIPLDEFFNRLTKRLIDIIGSLVLIALSLPVMLCVAVGIKLTSPGPVFFKQDRVGHNRKIFKILKFRSMRVSTNEVACTTWTTSNDPRRTTFGEVIRKTSLDELPQFFNVLKGDMSLIGPRPERPHFVEQFMEEIPKYMVKHQVKPGITGWAQVNGWRGDTSIEERIKCVLYYIENWSLGLDLKILFMTAFKGFINKNAY